MGLKRKLGGFGRAISPRKWLKWSVKLLLIAVIFVIGVGVGDGLIASYLPWHTKPVTKGLPNQLDYSSLDQVYQSLKDNYDGQVTETQLLNGLKHGLAQATNDPYTEYFTAREAKTFNDQLNNSFSGIGAELGKDSDGNLQIIAPISGAPAAQAGLQAQDLITAINGVSTSGISVDAAVNKIRGPAGTKVTLQIVRHKAQVLTIPITRQNITAPSIITKTLPNNIGYIQIITFADDTTQLAQKAADQFKQANVKGLVLDLRDNPGGLLDAAVHVSSLWLPQGQTVLQEKRGDAVIQTYYALGGDKLHGIPTVVLINGGSASASEITAGTLHDNGAAYVIGQKSYGKGVVQSVICITGARNADSSCPADELKVTVASWFRPNGQNINHHGITPDKTVTVSDTQAKASVDPQLQAAESYLAGK